MKDAHVREIELARSIVNDPERWTIYEVRLAECIVRLTTPPSEQERLVDVLVNKRMNDD